MALAAVMRGTGAATSGSHPYSLQVDGLDVARQPGTTYGSLFGTDIDSLMIDERYGEPPSASFVIDDPGKALSISRGVPVYICDHLGLGSAAGARVTDDLFRGFVNDYERDLFGLGWQWRVSALGLEAYMDRRRLTGGVVPSGADTVAALQQVLSTLDPSVSVLAGDAGAITVDATPPNLLSGVGAFSQQVAVSLAGKTYRQACDDVVAASSVGAIALSGSLNNLDMMVVDIDAQGRVRWIPSPARLPLITIREGSGASSTQAAPQSIHAGVDLSSYVSRVYVQGVDATSSGWVTNTTAEATYGRGQDAYITPESAVSAAARDALGAAYLTANRPIERLTFDLADSHDSLIPALAAGSPLERGWHVRQSASLVSDSGLFSTATRRAWQVQKTFKGGGTSMHLTLGFGGGLRAGASSIAAGLAGVRRDTASAGRLSGTLSEVAIRSKAGVPTDADFDVPRDGFLVLDTTNKVTWIRMGGLWVPSQGYVYDRAEITAPINVTATGSPGTTLITGAAVIYDGTTPVLIEFVSDSLIVPSVAGGFVQVQIYEDGADLATVALAFNSVASGLRVPGYGAKQHTPTAGSHTYSIRGYRDAGLGTATVDAGTGVAGTRGPAFMSITRA